MLQNQFEYMLVIWLVYIAASKLAKRTVHSTLISLLFFSSKRASTTGRWTLPPDRLYQDSSAAFVLFPFLLYIFLVYVSIRRLHNALALLAQLWSPADALFDLGHCPHLLFLRVPTEDLFLFLFYLRFTLVL